MSDRSLFLGIDLGTTNSAAAVFDGTQVHLVRNAQGTTLTPSIIRLDAKGNALVGAKARRMLDADPDNTRGEFKRLMGTGQLIDFPAAKKKLKPEDALGRGAQVAARRRAGAVRRRPRCARSSRCPRSSSCPSRRPPARPRGWPASSGSS